MADKIFLDKGGDVEEVEGRERRAHVRFPVCLEVKVNGREKDECVDFILNTGRGGVFIMTERPLETGSEIYLKFYIPPVEVLSEFEGLVVGANTDDPKYPKGMHVKFINCSKDDLKRLEEFLEGKRHLVDEEA